VQALTPAPGELITQPPHRSRLPRSTQAAGHQDRGKSHCGFGRLRHRCALRAILPLRRLLLTSARSARVLTQGDCRTERPTALRREPSRSTSPGELPAQSLRELASSQPFRLRFATAAQDASGPAVQPLRKLHIKVPRCGTTVNQCSAETARLLLLWSFGMQRRHIVYNAQAAREATSLRHPLHCRSGNNGTSGSDHRLHQVGNSLCLPHHSQFENINGPQTCPQASCGFGCSLSVHSTGGVRAPHRQLRCLSSSAMPSGCLQTGRA